MAKHYDVKSEWEKTKKQLAKFGKEATKLAKKGEKELLNFTQQSKIQLDSTAVGLKKEKLYYQIGKEFVKLKDISKPNVTIKNLLEEYQDIDAQQQKIKAQLKRKSVKKKAVKKAAKKVTKKTVKKVAKKATKKAKKSAKRKSA